MIKIVLLHIFRLFAMSFCGDETWHMKLNKKVLKSNQFEKTKLLNVSVEKVLMIVTMGALSKQNYLFSSNFSLINKSNLPSDCLTLEVKAWVIINIILHIDLYFVNTSGSNFLITIRLLMLFLMQCVLKYVWLIKFRGMNRDLPNMTQVDFYVSNIWSSIVLLSVSAAFNFISLLDSTYRSMNSIGCYFLQLIFMISNMYVLCAFVI